MDGQVYFSGGMLPSIKQFGKAIEGKFVMEDWHNFGADYNKTLMCWFVNFSENWETIKNNYDDRFFSDVEILFIVMCRRISCSW
jgi:cyclopropane-fatty-acyl-phospholipid synthase